VSRHTRQAVRPALFLLGGVAVLSAVFGYAVGRWHGSQAVLEAALDMPRETFTVTSQIPVSKPAIQQAAVAPGVAVKEANEEDKRSAIKHWNNGIIYFQQADYDKARDEWLLCAALDPRNEDCVTGLQRIDNTFGGGL